MTTQDTTKTNTFSPATPSLDPSKHVNYSLGMVLGVDDFNQEFAYLSNRDQWLARDLLGYGTVCGLDVSYEKKDKDGKAANNLLVEPGVALSPSGKFIKVNFTQCADIQKWLEDKNIQAGIVKATKKANKAALDAALAAKAASKAILSKKAKADLAKLELAAAKEDLIGDSIKLYLTLCYRDCLTDLVQIAGEPCRTETGDDNSLLKPSRIQNDFSLDLSFDQEKLPDQTEENALRDFAAWLREFKVAGSGSLTPDDFAQAISAAIKKQMDIDKQRPMDFVNQMSKSIIFASAQLSEFLRAAFRVWTTELRPLVRGANADCVNPSQVDCVLLAELDVTLTGDWGLKTVIINEERRPYLLHLRMLQEWMLQNSHFPGDSVVDEKGWGQSSAAGESELFSRADHTHGTPDLDGDVVVDKSADNPIKNIIARLQKKLVNAPNPTLGQVLTFAPSAEESGEWQANDLPELAGEVTGPIGATRVAKILNLPVADQADNPKAGKVLTLKTLPGPGGQVEWQAMDLPVAPPPSLPNGDVINLSTGNKISKLQGKTVNAASPKNGQILRFVGQPDDAKGYWETQDLPNSPANTQFVTRSLSAPYGIVAAGACSFEVTMAESGFLEFSQLPAFRSRYNQLVFIEKSSSPDSACFSFDGYRLPNLDSSKGPTLDYIIKLTPGWEPKRSPFEAHFIDYKDEYFIIGFSVHATHTPGTLMIEVSRFEPDPLIGRA